MAAINVCQHFYNSQQLVIDGFDRALNVTLTKLITHCERRKIETEQNRTKITHY